MAVAFPSIGIGATLLGFIVLFIIYLLIVGFVLCLAGASITFLGLIGVLLGLVIFLLLVKHYFKTGWIGAIGVAIMAVVVGVVLTFILGALALGALFGFPKIF